MNAKKLSGAGQFLQQSLGVLQVWQVEAFGEPSIDLGQRSLSVRRLSLTLPEPAKADRRLQFQQLCLLPTSALNSLVEVRFGLFQFGIADCGLRNLDLRLRTSDFGLFLQRQHSFQPIQFRIPGEVLGLPCQLEGHGEESSRFLLANLAYVVTLPLGGIQHAAQDRVGTAMMEAIIGAPGAVLMAAAVMISTLGTINGIILGGARVSYAMARDRLFFAGVGSVNARRVPAVALMMQCVWASLLTLPRTATIDAVTGAATYGNVYTQLLEYAIPVDLVFYGLMTGAVIVLRRKAPDAERPYRTIGYPVTPLIYICVATLLILDLAYLAPATSGIGYLLALSSIPVYLIWHGRPDRRVALEEVRERP
jgi:hypothetical protein